MYCSIQITWEMILNREAFPCTMEMIWNKEIVFFSQMILKSLNPFEHFEQVEIDQIERISTTISYNTIFYIWFAISIISASTFEQPGCSINIMSFHCPLVNCFVDYSSQQCGLLADFKRVCAPDFIIDIIKFFCIKALFRFNILPCVKLYI